MSTLRLVGGRPTLPAAIGSTAYSEPVVKQALSRVREGKLSKNDFAKLYSGFVRSGFLKGKVKHEPKHGFSPFYTAERQVATLQEF